MTLEANSIQIVVFGRWERGIGGAQHWWPGARQEVLHQAGDQLEDIFVWNFELVSAWPDSTCLELQHGGPHRLEPFLSQPPETPYLWWNQSFSQRQGNAPGLDLVTILATLYRWVVCLLLMTTTQIDDWVWACLDSGGLQKLAFRIFQESQTSIAFAQLLQSRAP